MIPSKEESVAMYERDPQRTASHLLKAWPYLIEIWIAGVLVTFFVVRIVGSQTAQSILSHLHKTPSQ